MMVQNKLIEVKENHYYIIELVSGTQVKGEITTENEDFYSAESLHGDKFEIFKSDVKRIQMRFFIIINSFGVSKKAMYRLKKICTWPIRI